METESAEWRALVDKKSGRTYYFNKTTKQTRWSLPEGATCATATPTTEQPSAHQSTPQHSSTTPFPSTSSTDPRLADEEKTTTTVATAAAKEAHAKPQHIRFTDTATAPNETTNEVSTHRKDLSNKDAADFNEPSRRGYEPATGSRFANSQLGSEVSRWNVRDDRVDSFETKKTNGRDGDGEEQECTVQEFTCLPASAALSERLQYLSDLKSQVSALRSQRARLQKSQHSSAHATRPSTPPPASSAVDGAQISTTYARSDLGATHRTTNADFDALATDAVGIDPLEKIEEIAGVGVLDLAMITAHMAQQEKDAVSFVESLIVDRAQFHEREFDIRLSRRFAPQLIQKTRSSVLSASVGDGYGTPTNDRRLLDDGDNGDGDDNGVTSPFSPYREMKAAAAREKRDGDGYDEDDDVRAKDMSRIFADAGEIIGATKGELKAARTELSGTVARSLSNSSGAAKALVSRLTDVIREGIVDPHRLLLAVQARADAAQIAATKQLMIVDELKAEAAALRSTEATRDQKRRTNRREMLHRLAQAEHEHSRLKSAVLAEVEAQKQKSAELKADTTKADRDRNQVSEMWASLATMRLQMEALGEMVGAAEARAVQSANKLAFDGDGSSSEDDDAIAGKDDVGPDTKSTDDHGKSIGENAASHPNDASGSAIRSRDLGKQRSIIRRLTALRHRLLSKGYDPTSSLPDPNSKSDKKSGQGDGEQNGGGGGGEGRRSTERNQCFVNDSVLMQTKNLEAIRGAIAGLADEFIPAVAFEVYSERRKKAGARPQYDPETVLLPEAEQAHEEINRTPTPTAMTNSRTSSADDTTLTSAARSAAVSALDVRSGKQPRTISVPDDTLSSNVYDSSDAAVSDSALREIRGHTSSVIVVQPGEGGGHGGGGDGFDGETTDDISADVDTSDAAGHHVRFDAADDKSPNRRRKKHRRFGERIFATPTLPADLLADAAAQLDWLDQQGGEGGGGDDPNRSISLSGDLEDPTSSSAADSTHRRHTTRAGQGKTGVVSPGKPNGRGGRGSGASRPRVPSMSKNANSITATTTATESESGPGEEMLSPMSKLLPVDAKSARQKLLRTFAENSEALNSSAPEEQRRFFEEHGGSKAAAAMAKLTEQHQHKSGSTQTSTSEIAATSVEHSTGVRQAPPPDRLLHRPEAAESAAGTPTQSTRQRIRSEIAEIVAARREGRVAAALDLPPSAVKSTAGVKSNKQVSRGDAASKNTRARDHTPDGSVAERGDRKGAMSAAASLVDPVVRVLRNAERKLDAARSQLSDATSPAGRKRIFEQAAQRTSARKDRREFLDGESSHDHDDEDDERSSRVKTEGQGNDDEPRRKSSPILDEAHRRRMAAAQRRASPAAGATSRSVSTTSQTPYPDPRRGRRHSLDTAALPRGGDDGRSVDDDSIRLSEERRLFDAAAPVVAAHGGTRAADESLYFASPERKEKPSTHDPRREHQAHGSDETPSRAHEPFFKNAATAVIGDSLFGQTVHSEGEDDMNASLAKVPLGQNPLDATYGQRRGGGGGPSVRGGRGRGAARGSPRGRGRGTAMTAAERERNSGPYRNQNRGQTIADDEDEDEFVNGREHGHPHRGGAAGGYDRIAPHQQSNHHLNQHEHHEDDHDHMDEMESDAAFHAAQSRGRRGSSGARRGSSTSVSPGKSGHHKGPLERAAEEESQSRHYSDSRRRSGSEIPSSIPEPQASRARPVVAAKPKSGVQMPYGAAKIQRPANSAAGLHPRGDRDSISGPASTSTNTNTGSGGLPIGVGVSATGSGAASAHARKVSPGAIARMKAKVKPPIDHGRSPSKFVSAEDRLREVEAAAEAQRRDGRSEAQDRAAARVAAAMRAQRQHKQEDKSSGRALGARTTSRTSSPGVSSSAVRSAANSRSPVTSRRIAPTSTSARPRVGDTRSNPSSGVGATAASVSRYRTQFDPSAESHGGMVDRDAYATSASVGAYGDHTSPLHDSYRGSAHLSSRQNPHQDRYRDPRSGFDNEHADHGFRTHPDDDVLNYDPREQEVSVPPAPALGGARGGGRDVESKRDKALSVVEAALANLNPEDRDFTWTDGRQHNADHPTAHPSSDHRHDNPSRDPGHGQGPDGGGRRFASYIPPSTQNVDPKSSRGADRFDAGGGQDGGYMEAIMRQNTEPPHADDFAPAEHRRQAVQDGRDRPGPSGFSSASLSVARPRGSVSLPGAFQAASQSVSNNRDEGPGLGDRKSTPPLLMERMSPPRAANDFHPSHGDSQDNAVSAREETPMYTYDPHKTTAGRSGGGGGLGGGRKETEGPPPSLGQLGAMRRGVAAAYPNVERQLKEVRAAATGGSTAQRAQLQKQLAKEMRALER